VASEPLLEVRDLHKYFTVRDSLLRRARRVPAEVLRAVDGVNLTIQPGEALGLVGESGCGKSTLGRCVVGLYEPTSGEIHFRGVPLSRERAERRHMQIVFQDPYSSLNPRMTVRQVIGEVLRVHDVVPAERVDARCAELIDLVGLGQRALDAYPRQLSGGQRQRVSIARALALEPELLVADEPVSALDVSVQANVLNLLERLREQLDLALLFIAHNLAVVRHVCDRVAVMYLGRIVEEASTEEVFRNPRHPYTQGLLKAIPRLVPGQASTAVAIAGDPPSPINLPSGCRFHPRCQLAQQICHEQDPALTAGAPGTAHVAACHFAWGGATSPHRPEVEVEISGGGAA
jgi:oligopeptide/dipeptide ABC transporter ATP-binding protein